jgi:endogenous inhibitor of DNA gyrase (YacG/DUF329 family)
MAQLSAANIGWKCPKCGRDANWIGIDYQCPNCQTWVSEEEESGVCPNCDICMYCNNKGAPELENKQCPICGVFAGENDE